MGHYTCEGRLSEDEIQIRQENDAFCCWGFFEIVTILGYHGLSYLTNQLGILHVLTVIFAGLYDFLESIWLIGSVALVAYLVYLLKMNQVK